MDELELKPCPFCGGEAAVIANVGCAGAARGDYRAWEFGVVCLDCNISLPRHNYRLSARLAKCGRIVVEQDERQEAADLWNRRADNGNG